ncbi:MAG: hypothetical protein EXS36_15110 [Pedosphaera sp.]|nr:hypothetical protein [Pedosphaera sp.]
MTESRVQSFWQIVATPEPPELGPGPRPGVSSPAVLNRKLNVWVLTLGIPLPAVVHLRATALLYHDQHDPAHDLVQDLVDTEAALVHAILHRREPDYWNAKYWFRRITEHPVYVHLPERLHRLTSDSATAGWLKSLTLAGPLDPFAFVDACENVSRRPPEDPEAVWLRKVQQLEFEALIDHLVV